MIVQKSGVSSHKLELKKERLGELITPILLYYKWGGEKYD